jgi:hypothetical protein
MSIKSKFYLSGREVRERGPLDVTSGDAKWNYEELDTIGFSGLSAMDTALTGPATQSGLINREFLQHQIAGVVKTGTRVRVLDEITGVMFAGNWYDEEIVLNIETAVGKAELYGDYTNIPLADYLQDMEKRGIVRFEQGFHVGKLEDARQGAMGWSAAESKRRSATESLEQSRERVGFFGFSGGTGRVFGLLNDPNLPAYITGGVGSWVGKTFAQLTSDLTMMFTALEASAGGLVKDDTSLTLVLPSGYRPYLAVANTVGAGETVRAWMQANFPNVRVIYAPEFVGANGGANVAYLFADNVDDDSTGTSATFIQIVPVKYQVLGSENQIKGYLEDAVNATAGVIVTRPWAVARLSGI